jgi:hypothetical protein
MNKFLLLACIAVVAIGLIAPAATLAATHSVTFRVNTATVPDTITAISPMVITGGGSKGGDTVLTGWGAGVPLTNIGGDYWTTTLDLGDSAQIAFKIRFGANGWETDLTGNGNRNLLVTKDTVLDLEFWNSGHFPSGKNISMFDLPYVPANDTMINVYVRVNLKAIADNGLNGWTTADKDSVCIMGGGPTGGDLDWGTPHYITEEQDPTNSATAFGMPAGTFYSGVIHIPKSQVTAGQDMAYKFRLGSNWNYGTLQRSEQLDSGNPKFSGGNRHFTIPVGLKDTTLQWVYFQEVKPGARENTDAVTITFHVNMRTAIQAGGFTLNQDTIEVQSGFFTTADSTRTLILERAGGSTIFVGQQSVVTALNKSFDYQYYVVTGGQTVRENYYNFIYPGDVQSERERRQVFPSSGTIDVWDTVGNVADSRRQPYFPSQRNLTQAVKVTWTVDMRPAYYQIWAGSTLHDIQGFADVNYVDSIAAWGVAINGPATGGPNGPLSINWATWDRNIVADSSQRKMWDDGTHGDALAGDSIYAVQFDYTTLNQVGQIYKFGIRGGDNEAGSGGFGANEVININDGASTFKAESQWGEINVGFYSAWDYPNHKPAGATSVGPDGTPLVYSLGQNYPNPFNPATVIDFSIAKQSVVTLKVFNILGQEVSTLVNETMLPGNHQVSFNARNLASGMYFYRLQAGNFTDIRKMVILK